MRKCHKCQIHSDLIHIPSFEVYNLTIPWPFSVWGIDIIGKVTPKASNGHEFILVASDYFKKWVEATSYAKLTSVEVTKFFRTNIICRFGVLHKLISGRGFQFKVEIQALL